MTYKQQQIVLEWLTAHAKSTCDSCSGTDHRVHPAIIVGVPFRGRTAGGSRDPAPALPVVAATCGGCGHIRFFSATKIGIVA